MAGLHHGSTPHARNAAPVRGGVWTPSQTPQTSSATSDLDEIRSAAAQFRPNERNLALYFPDFGRAPEAGSLNRVFGMPTGIGAEQWPQYQGLEALLAPAGTSSKFREGDLRMEHVLTVDLRDVRLIGVPHGARAMMLFISDTAHHRADQNGNDHTRVLFLSDEQVARHAAGCRLPARSRNRWSRRFSLARIDVPGDVFDPVQEGDDAMARLQDAVWQAPARLGGCPIWLRNPDDPRDFLRTDAPTPPTVGLAGTNTFVMQFERRFADVALGNDGVMYVSGTGAYYQSYE